MYNRLIEKKADVLGASYIMGNRKKQIEKDSISACFNSAAPWNWVAKIDSIRNIKWDTKPLFMIGTRYWLKMLNNNLNIVTESNLWCYYWLPSPNGLFETYGKLPTYDLYEELLKLIIKNNRYELLENLKNRMIIAGFKFDDNPLLPQILKYLYINKKAIL